MRWLQEALALACETESLFADAAGGWFMTSDAHETLIAREKPAYDGAEPSGTSVALMNAARLAVFTNDDKWRQIAERGFRAHVRVLVERPMAMTEALLALDFFLDRTREIAIVWPAGADVASAESLLTITRQTFLPARVLAGASEAEVGPLGQIVPFVRDKSAPNGRPTAYVCRHGWCALPTAEPDQFAAQLVAREPT
jgi:uncharacterized protein YyaL (SSP411 family)